MVYNVYLRPFSSIGIDYGTHEHFEDAAKVFCEHAKRLLRPDYPLCDIREEYAAWKALFPQPIREVLTAFEKDGRAPAASCECHGSNKTYSYKLHHNELHICENPHRTLDLRDDDDRFEKEDDFKFTIYTNALGMDEAHDTLIFQFLTVDGFSEDLILTLTKKDHA